MRFLFLIFLLTVGIAPLSAGEMPVITNTQPCFQEDFSTTFLPYSTNIQAPIKIIRALQKSNSSQRNLESTQSQVESGLKFFQCKLSDRYSPKLEYYLIHKRIESTIQANAP